MPYPNLPYDLQFDYFSDNYRQFQDDFYRFSKLPSPLSFIEDDILHHMASSQTPCFKLSKNKSLDQKDHYFHFQVTSPPHSPLVRIYHYQGHSDTHNK